LTRPIDIRVDHLRIIQDVLHRHLPPGVKVWVFGSRAAWTTKDSSDLDLAIESDGQFDLRAMTELKDAFHDSDLPYTVDVVDLNRIEDSFRQIVDSQRVPLPLDGDRTQRQVRLVGTAVSGVPSVQGTLTVTSGQWRKVTLGECSVINDANYSPKEAWPIINYLDTGNISENRVSEIQQFELSRDMIPSRARRKVQPGDIVYSTVRPNHKHFGVLKSVPENFLASTAFAVLRGRDDIANTGFIYWFLAQDHIVDYLHSIAENSTSAYPSIRPDDLERVTLSLPPLLEQRAIANILGTLDDKIDLNRRMNGTLEAMARALFKSWFVDFDPVRAKATLKHNAVPFPQGGSDRSVGCARAYLGRMDPSIAALFPDSFVDSELGPIPEGWKFGVLDDVVELLSGGTPKTSVSEYWDGNIPWYTARDAPSLSDVFVLETERNITQSGVEHSAAKIHPAQTTIITARGTVGRLACLGRPMAMNQTCYGIRGARGYPVFFTYWNVRMTVDELRRRTHGTIFDTITRQTFKLVNSVVPPVELAGRFDKAILPVMTKMLSNLEESRKLAAVRDALLPKLIAGELRMSVNLSSVSQEVV